MSFALRQLVHTGRLTLDPPDARKRARVIARSLVEAQVMHALDGRVRLVTGLLSPAANAMRESGAALRADREDSPDRRGAVYLWSASPSRTAAALA
jgi:hypothetical protein